MPCKTCNHLSNEHEYNRDWGKREQCTHKNEKHQRCNCRKFVK